MSTDQAARTAVERTSPAEALTYRGTVQFANHSPTAIPDISLHGKATVSMNGSIGIANTYSVDLPRVIQNNMVFKWHKTATYFVKEMTERAATCYTE